MGFNDSKEEGFAPNHYCVHHGGVEHDGQIVQAEAISHNWNEELQKVTAYNMRLPNGVILEAVPAEDILVTKASLVNEHAAHPVPKRDTPKRKIRMALKENKRYSDYVGDKGRMDNWREYLTEVYEDIDDPCNAPEGNCPDHDPDEAQASNENQLAEKKKEKKEKDWIKKAVNPKHKGYCTPMTKETCTPERKRLAKLFKGKIRAKNLKKGKNPHGYG